MVVGLGAQFCTLSEVWVLGVGMSTLGAQTSSYTEDRGIQVPMTLEHGIIVGTQCYDNTVPCLVRPDPRVRQRILPSRYVQIYWNGPHCVSRVANKTNKVAFRGKRTPTIRSSRSSKSPLFKRGRFCCRLYRMRADSLRMLYRMRYRMRAYRLVHLL